MKTLRAAAVILGYSFLGENCLTDKKTAYDKADIPDYESGIRLFLGCLTGKEFGVIESVTEIDRVGYKATLSKGHLGVHELDDEVLRGMENWISLAPLHNRAYLAAIKVLMYADRRRRGSAEKVRKRA